MEELHNYSLLTIKKLNLINQKQFMVMVFEGNKKTFVVFITVFIKYINFAKVNYGNNKNTPFSKDSSGFATF